MSERLTTEQMQLVAAYKQQFAELRIYSDEQILSIINNDASALALSEDERVSILSNTSQNLNLGGLSVESQQSELSQEQESQILSMLRARSEAVTSKTEEAESKNGFLGKAWNWTKNNLLDWCTDSTNDIKKAQKEEEEVLNSGNLKEAFEKITGLEYTNENLQKFLNNEVPTKSEQALQGYEEGQEMAADFAGDMISGIAAVGIYTAAIAAAPFTGGASIALGLGLAAAGGGLIKSGIKAWDAHSAGREYDSFGKDMITGGFSGVLAPITGGFGGAVGRGVAAKLGVQALKHAGKEAVEVTGKQTLKTILSNPVGYEYAGKRAFLALGAEMATDGALGGSIDTTFRTAYEMNEKGEEITAGALFSSFVQGGIGGFFMAPVIGGGMKGMGKLTGKIFGKNADEAVPTRPKVALPENIKGLSDLFMVSTISDEEADIILRNAGLSDAEIGNLRRNTEDLNTIVAAFRRISDEEYAEMSIDKMSPAEIIQAIRETAASDDAQVVKYFNDNNLNIVRDYFCDEDDKPADVLISMLNRAFTEDSFDTQLSIANEIHRISGVSIKDAYDEVRYRYEDDLPLLTRERIIAQNEIRKILGEDEFSTFCCVRIEDPSKITPEFLRSFETDVNKARNFGISLSYNNNVMVFAEELNRVVAKCEQEGLNLNFADPVSLSSVESILQTGDLNAVKQFINSCSDKCKEKFGNQIIGLLPDNELGEKLPLYTKFYNALAEFKTEPLPSDIKNPAEFLDALKENGVTDFDGVFNLIKAFDEIGIWPERDNIHNFIIKNGDYDSAVQFVRELAAVPAKDGQEPLIQKFVTSRYRWDTKQDFKVLLERLQSIDKNILDDDILGWLPLSKNPDCVNIIHQLNKYGLNEYIRFYIYDHTNVTSKQFQEKLDIMVREIRDEDGGFADIDDGFLLRLLFSGDCRDIWVAPMRMLEKDAKSIDDIQSFFWRTTNTNGAVKSIKDIINDQYNKGLIFDIIKRRQEFGLSDKEAIDVIKSLDWVNGNLAKQLIEDSSFPREHIKLVLKHIDEFNLPLAEKLYKASDFDNKEIVDILYYSPSTASCLSVAEEVAFRKDLAPHERRNILHRLNEENVSIAHKIISDNSFDKNYIEKIISVVNKENIAMAEKLLASETFSLEQIARLVSVVNKENFAMAEKLLASETFSPWQIANMISVVNKGNISIAEKLLAFEVFSPEQITNMLSRTINNKEVTEYAEKLCNQYKAMELDIDKIPFLISNYGKVDYKQLRRFQRLAGRDVISGLDDSELSVACQMADLYKKQSINEIPVSAKKDLLRSLVACNEGLFNVSPKIREMFPLIPTDRDSYCTLFPAIVRSMGIETNTLSAGKVANFNHSVSGLSSTLAKLSDSDFSSLNITQEFSREDFIRVTLDKVKHLSAGERQKVYDYFGFELHKNKTNETGYSITGYPVNLNNGKKLAEISDPSTKSVVESLRADVVRFSEQNPIKCNNPEIEKLLNDVVDVLPELRAQIGKIQHGAHDYTVLQHSLKVMQKISQDANFQKLNESDKKIMMLASLLHDITKREGVTDRTHASEGSFDAFFIAKKFNLTKEEEIKLFTLTRHHEWLSYVNTARSSEELTRRLQSVAYDLRQDNLFDMALMFTHADLRAVKIDDSFHDTTLGSSRARFNGEERSFNDFGTAVSHGEAAERYAQTIRYYVNELKKSQPLLPVTKMPKASSIARAVTRINADGSTNIKGVYKDSDGLIVIKYNEVEDWEAIGFPAGTRSRGTVVEDIGANTGNLKFFVHGLDYVNQLAKFDAFGLIDSDVLLSVSYAERPESKYRFFRTQGVILDVDTKYIHGGGETDSGSGCGKFLNEFKNRYLFGGQRESDRLYVSNLIKEATGMSDEEYIAFVKANENKSMLEIEPADVREKIIQAFATINSRVRRGEREYNEMYLTNPEVMGVFAYPSTGEVGNALDFLNGKTGGVEIQKIRFLREHALERDLPFVVFGD